MVVIRIPKLILSRVNGSVTNNNRLWIGWLDLLTRFTITCNQNQFTITQNKWLPKTRTILTGLRLSSLLVFSSQADFQLGSESESESNITTDGQSASVSWNKALMWGLWPDFYHCQTVVGLLIWGALSDERTGLSFTVAAGCHQCSHFRVWVPWDSWPYFTVSDSRLPFSSPMTCRATVEVFDSASTQD
jgi:hypothetical protein